MRVSIADVQKMKRDGQRIPMVTAYDYTSAQLVDRAGVPLILVGDSLGMVVQGNDSTLPVTVDDIIYHAKMVVRGSKNALVIGDMPFLSYTTVDEAVGTARRLMQESGVQAVKLEGGVAVAPMLQRVVALGVPVMGHLGYTPQSVHQIGTRVQGKRSDEARQLIEDALTLQAAGAFAIVLELVPTPLAAAITERLTIPTIGIGAGPACDGQVQVWHDLFGLYSDFVPRHAKRFAAVGDTIAEALGTYAKEVREGSFPTAQHSAKMDADALNEAIRAIDEGR